MSIPAEGTRGSGHRARGVVAAQDFHDLVEAGAELGEVLAQGLEVAMERQRRRGPRLFQGGVGAPRRIVVAELGLAASSAADIAPSVLCPW